VELFGCLVRYGATGPIFGHWLRRQFLHTIRSLPLIWFPRH
jgi:hypothetical protein